MSATQPRTLFDKIWDSHVVERLPDGTCILYIDRHLRARGDQPAGVRGPAPGRPQAAPPGLHHRGRRPQHPDRRVARAAPTSRKTDSRIQVQTLEKNVVEFGVPYIPILDERQGIVHIIGPELGLSLPGMTIVCGDSHTSTHGALGALAFGIGTSEVEHVMATQTLLQAPAKNMQIEVTGTLGFGCSAQGHRAGDHRQDQHRRRHRPRHRIHRRDDPRAGHGGPHDGVQHDDRGRRARRPDRAGRDHVRLRQGPRLRAEGRGVGAGGGVLAHAADRSPARTTTRRCR